VLVPRAATSRDGS